ncbi:MAG: hypothetical protein QXH32_08985 [Candidatus Caldarchaeum sp.]
MRCWLFLIILLFLPAVYGLEPPPSGTPFGKFYVRVVDCSSQQPIAGASVNLDNPGHRVSSVTNTTGYAEMQGYAWFYTYYITAGGYRFTQGERRFAIGEVFTTCLFRETGGFWRVVSDLLSWQGVIHAGGAGWGLVRLKNFEPGVFNITSIELMVSGYDRPVGFWTSDRGDSTQAPRHILQPNNQTSSRLSGRKA